MGCFAVLRVRSFVLFSLFFALLFSPVVFAGSCTDHVAKRMLVPAVDSKGGGIMVGVEAASRAGSGVVYTSTTPITGAETQDSENNAVAAAARESGVNAGACDVFFRVEAGGATNWVNGPSGGAAFTLLAYSVFENKSFRKDLAVTGTIERDGRIGNVGGIISKSRAALESGVHYVIVPEQDFGSKIMLLSLMEKWPLKFIEVKDFSEVKQIAFSNGSVGKEFSFAPRQWVEVEGIDARQGVFHDAFKQLVRELIDDSNRRVQALKTGGIQNEFVVFLESELAISEKLLGKNYVYSAGNTAFLAGIDSGMVSYGDLSAGALQAKASAVGECVKKTNLKDGLNSGNFEWRTGGQVRLNWAKKRLAEVRERGFDSADAQLQDLNDVLYAEGWCGTAGKIGAAKIDGRPVDEARLKEFARAALSSAEARLSARESAEFEEAKWHLQVAKKAFEDGEYGASVFDSVMAASAVNAYDQINNSMTREQLLAVAEKLSSEKVDGFWAFTYQSQAVYYVKKSSDAGDLVAAVRLAEYAKELDASVKSMNEILSGKKSVEAGAGETSFGIGGIRIDSGAISRDFENLNSSKKWNALLLAVVFFGGVLVAGIALLLLFWLAKSAKKQVGRSGKAAVHTLVKKREKTRKNKF